MIRRTKATAAGLALAGVLALAACSSGTPAASPTETSDDVSPEIQAVIDELETYNDPQPDFEVPPLSAAAPKDIHVAIMTCPIPVCSLYTQGAEDAAEVLGWTTKAITAQFTPESFSAAWDSILLEEADVVLFVGSLPLDPVRDKIQQAKDQGAVLVGYALGAEPVGPDELVSMGASGDPDQATSGHLLGLQAIGTAGAAIKAAIVVEPAFPGTAIALAAVQKVFDSVGAELDVIEISQATVGQVVPGQVVTYLQANPDVKTVMFAADDFSLGVPAAIQAAGLEDIRIIGTNASTTSQKLVESGEIFSSALHPTYFNSWRLLDAAARVIVGDPVPDPNPDGPFTTVTRENSSLIGDADFWAPVMRDVFTEVWTAQ